MTEAPTTVDTFLGLTSTGWTAVAGLATVAAVLIALVGAVLAVRQLRVVIEQGNESRIAALEAARPYVVVSIEPGEVSRAWMNLVVRNQGQRPALRVRVRLEPEPVRAEEVAGAELASARILREEIAMIVPGQELSTFFDAVSDRQANPELSTVFTAHVTYADSTGHLFEETSPLDFAALSGTLYTDVLTTHHGVKVLKEIRDQFRRASALQRQGHVSVDATTEPREVARARRAAEAEEQRACAEAGHADPVARLLPEQPAARPQEAPGGGARGKGSPTAADEHTD